MSLNVRIEDGGTQPETAPAVHARCYRNSPVWSPDGRRLALKAHCAHLYASNAGKTIRYESLYVMEQDGSGLIELLRTDRSTGRLIAGPFTWFPNGQEITFARAARPSGQGIDLISVALDGSASQDWQLRQGQEEPGNHQG